ncbi:MAG: NAD(P)/FAD-dependent oxidoreductase [Actinobacteria bacterium]|nr:NAD(P)/FAD-dependent oxidoreductase [Actinomycetota bacterium]
MPESADVCVIGAGHNGLACACYLARAGLEVSVVEAAGDPGGCINTVTLPDGRGRLELGAYEHGGIRGSGVAADLELESRFGLRFRERDEQTLSPCDDGTQLAFWSSLERTVEGLSAVVGTEDAEAYRRFAGWAGAAIGVLGQADAGPPPSLRGLAALAEAALGREGQRLVQSFLAPATALTEAAFADERLRGVLDHWAAHSQLPPQTPGTGAGALFLAASHGSPAVRPEGGSRGTVDALVRCLEAAGGRLRCGAPAERIEVAGGRARAVVAGGERIEARRAVVSAIDARRVFLGLIDRDQVPAPLLAEVERIHGTSHNVSELKVDAVLAAPPAVPGPPGFERAFMLSPQGGREIAAAFARIGCGELPERPPLMIAFPSSLEAGWAPEGGAVAWISTFVPWRPAAGAWDEALLERAADHAWACAERALGSLPAVRERVVTGPEQWVARHGNAGANPNHVEMSIDQLLALRPSPSLSGYRTPLEGLFLTGAGTHPGGGITGMPGRNAAGVVLERLGLRRRSRGAELRARAAMLRDAARAARTLRAG